MCLFFEGGVVYIWIWLAFSNWPVKEALGGKGIDDGTIVAD